MGFWEDQQRIVTFTPRVGVDGWTPANGVPFECSGLVAFSGVAHDGGEATAITDGSIRLFFSHAYAAALSVLVVGDIATVAGVDYEIQTVDTRGVLPVDEFPLRLEARRA
jgi:hypothetical protein